MSSETKGPQPPAEAQPCGCGEATCVVPWEPGCGLGKSGQHAEAQPVAPDDAEVICPGCAHQFRAIPVQVQRDMLAAGFEPPFLAPPSAPDGAVHDALQRDIDARGFAEIRQAELDALTRSAPSAPVGVEGLPERWRREAPQAGVDSGEDAARAYREAVYWCAFQLEEALAQQPAAVDEAMERAAEEIERYEHTFISTVGASAIIRKHMRAA